MRKLISIASICSMIALAAIAGCSSNDDPLKPTPIESGNYFPRTEGSYWVYEYYTTDSNGIVIADTKRIDSVTVQAETSKLEKLCNPFVTITSKGGTSTDYFYGDTNKLFALSDYVFLKQGAIPIQLPVFEQSWMKIADFAVESEIKLFDSTMAHLTFDWNGSPIQLENVNYYITAQKTTDKISITVNGKTQNAYCFVIKHHIAGKIIYGIYSLNFTTTPTIRNYYSANIGLVKTTMDPLVMTTAPIDLSSVAGNLIPKQGFSSTLVNYSIGIPVK